MSGSVLVAYDGSPNADDAVALGRLLARLTGSDLTLAHVYRAASRKANGDATVADGRDRFLARRGEEFLARAAGDDGEVRQIVLGATTTATGMRSLAEREDAVVVVFGSARNTEPGRVHPGSASRRLLQGAPCAVAFAPVGYRERGSAIPARIGFVHDDEDGAARDSAEALARAIGAAASVAEAAEGVDLLLIGSRSGAEPGRVMIAASAEAPLHAATSPALVVARGVALPSSGALASVA